MHRSSSTTTKAGESFWSRKVRKLIPHKDQLQGSFMHRVLGERLFASDLWRFTRRSVAGGMALGIFISMTPTFGIHMILAAIAALFLRVNIPVALAACWAVNPVVAPFIYGLQYKLGIWVFGISPPGDLRGYSGMMQNVVRHARPLWAGSMLMGIPSAFLAYALVHFGWERVAGILSSTRKHDSPNPPARDKA